MAFTFAHMADCHLGAWSMHPELRELSLKSFDYAIDECILRSVDFILISGDLFDTSMPPVEVLCRCAARLREVAEKGIRVYVIPGSHDFSASGKTMISVLESAGLVTNVAKGDEYDGKLKFFRDRSGAWITGILGRRGGLEKSYYESLKMETPEGFKIFMMHSAISEYKPEHLQQMDSIPLSLLPKGFDYYANGHVHTKFEKTEQGYGKIVFPGLLFPTEFKELEKGTGGFVIVDDSLNAEYIRAPLYEACVIDVDASGETPSEIERSVRAKLHDLGGAIVLVKIHGVMESGRPSDIDFKSMSALAHEKGALAFKKNISQLRIKEMEQIDAMPEHMEDIEDKIITEHLGQFNVFSDEKSVVKELMKSLSEEKGDTTASVYEERIKAEAKKILGV
ncbi:MAG: DNA repair exonuclease [Candidatus Aenigmarchaeota archaeon]|nr:DNA repair exonuclease [Candidatus Aenigmarchaeota archaeon]